MQYAIKNGREDNLQLLLLAGTQKNKKIKQYIFIYIKIYINIYIDIYIYICIEMKN